VQGAITSRGVDAPSALGAVLNNYWKNAMYGRNSSFSLKLMGSITVGVVGDVALALEGIIRKICKGMRIEIIDMAVNVDHVRLIIEYPRNILTKIHNQHQ